MKSIHILLVEDNEGDILLIREAFEEAKIINDISVVRDGEKAINYLNRQGKYKDAEKPDIIILDINLPRKNGHEVLDFIKNHDDFRHIPVIMLTTSSSEKDILATYNNHANSFITKPVDAEEFLRVVSGIEKYWIKLVKLPTQV